MTVTRVKFTREDLDKWQATLVDGAKKALAIVDDPSKAEYYAGEHCRWCDAKAVCPAYQKNLEDEAQIVFDDLSPETVVADPKLVSDEVILKVLTYRRDLEALFKSMEDYAISRYLDGNPIPGLKAVKGRSIRKWKDAPQITAERLENLGVVDPWNRKLKGITAIESEIGKGKLGDLTEKSEPSLKVVLEADPKQAVPNKNQQAIDVFGTLTNDKKE